MIKELHETGDRRCTTAAHVRALAQETALGDARKTAKEETFFVTVQEDL